jgi:hypothetical protein
MNGSVHDVRRRLTGPLIVQGTEGGQAARWFVRGAETRLSIPVALSAAGGIAMIGTVQNRRRWVSDRHG